MNEQKESSFIRNELQAMAFRFEWHISIEFDKDVRITVTDKRTGERISAVGQSEMDAFNALRYVGSGAASIRAKLTKYIQKRSLD